MILFSLLGASIALPRLLKGLQLPSDSGERKEEDLARRLSSKAALAGVERMRQQMVMNQNTENVQLYNDAASRVSLLYQRLEKGQRRARRGPGEGAAHGTATAKLRSAGLNAEREELFRLTRRGVISDEISRRLIRNLDLLESRKARVTLPRNVESSLLDCSSPKQSSKLDSTDPTARVIPASSRKYAQPCP